MSEYYDDSFETSVEFQQLVTTKKIDVLNRLVAAGHVSDGPKAVGVTELELLATAPTAEWPALQSALEQLRKQELISQIQYQPYDVGTFVGYELTDDIPPTLRNGKSDELIKQLNKQIVTKGIASLSPEEWALRYIVRSDDRDIDLVKIHRAVLEDLHDEGVEKWHRAFAGAVKQAEILFGRTT